MSAPAWGRYVRARDLPRKQDAEEGSTTVWFAAVMVVMMVVASTFIGAGTVFAARAQLQAATNLAALAAADAAPISAVVQASGTSGASGASAGPVASGCFVAEQVVQANGAALADCFHEGFDAFVVATSLVKVAGLPLKVRAKARAGPTAEGVRRLEVP